ncbi:MAG TPA: AAA family ATPase [Phycisphaerae bacterium]|nr:AAA family ATPase [Phycisphaerae bacterium]HNU46178.1 AAA family ATPase [Phycisphaerae bacterium]
MKLISVTVTKFRNILDSTDVHIQDDVTCLVGKNESGKTAFLHALYRLNPARPIASFSVPEQYPAWLEKQDRLRGEDLEKVTPIRAVFEIEKDDRAAIDERFGKGALTSATVTLAREYSGKRLFQFETNERKAVAHVVASAEIPGSVESNVKKVGTFEALSQLVAELQETGKGVAGAKDSGDDEEASVRRAEAAQAATSLENQIVAMLKGAKDFQEGVMNALSERLPRFFYYAEYSRLPGCVKIRELLKADPRNLDEDHHTALALLRLAAAADDYLLNPDYERRKRELENVANSLTAEVLKYWTQNPELRVLIDISQEVQTGPQKPPTPVLDELKVRMWDERHWLSLPFDERSTGFRWFFSFLAAFSQYEYTNDPIIILLDEPALGLHARAQRDFLRFIDERLAPKHQVVYTTHSAFMIQPGKLERVRIVEDRGREEGARVSSDVLSTDPDTVFPLQGALGYDMVQHLFIAPHNLVVEGTSDYTYLSVLSDFLRERGRTCLDPRWSIVPVGGADMIPTFVALLGVHLDVTVLVDAQKSGHQRLSQLAEGGYLAQKRIVTIGEVLGRKAGDIEDVFCSADYLLLYNRAFETNIKTEELTGTDPLVSRIARHQGLQRFDHGRPAEILLRHRDELLPRLHDDTLRRFETLFERINATLPAALQVDHEGKRKERH